MRAVSDAPVRPEDDFVLYVMAAFRRTGWNFALQRAADRARELGKPLVVLEPLLCGHRWDNDRRHSFILQGMAENARAFAKSPAAYCPLVETSGGEVARAAARLAARACLVVTDDYPTAGVPELSAAVAEAAPVLVEAVDSNGLLPLLAATRVYPTAYSFRRFLQEELPRHLRETPAKRPFAGRKLPPAPHPAPEDERHFASTRDALVGGRFAELVAAAPIDHGVAPARLVGGSGPARARLSEFVEYGLPRYARKHNHPDARATSRLSPYLACGHISAHEVFEAVAEAEGWSPDSLARKATGRREGWWGMSENAEAFLDELVTWRELGFNMCSRRDDYADYDSLPFWARKTLEEHAPGPREYVYSLDELEAAATHDELWNACQRELLEEGRIHNYLRMLWGKKILEWSRTPADALRAMIELNNRYALDGRNPNSYTGIFWVLGRYDRPWGPERPIYGKVRYMASESARRKLHLREYLERYGRG